jgi:hypothetical protein
MAGVEAPLMTTWQACERGERGGRRRGAGGAAGSAAWGEGGLQEGHRACNLATTAARLLSVVREKETRRKKKEGRKEKKRRREGKKEKEKENFSKHGNF